MKLQISVLHVDREPWKSLVDEGQITSWLLQDLHNTTVTYFCSFDNRFFQIINSLVEKMRWYMGRWISYFISYLLLIFLSPFCRFIPSSKPIDSNSAFVSFRRVRIPETIATMRWKRLAILDYFVNDSTNDYLVMTTSSSLLHVSRIKKFLCEEEESNQGLTEIPSIWGPINYSADGVFISGAFMILNRIAATNLLNNVKQIPVHTMDDISFGVAARRLGFSIRNLSSMTVKGMESLEDMNEEALDAIPHYRFAIDGKAKELETIRSFIAHKKTNIIFTNRKALYGNDST